MLPVDHRVSPNADAVAAEVIDGEAIIIDLATGVYYSMDGVGGSIWALIEAERTLEEIVAAIVARYEVSREQAHTDVQELLEQLFREKLILVSEQQSAARADPKSPPHQKLPYDAPKLVTYRDMGDLLALDPPVPGLQDIPWKTAAEKPRD